MTRPIVEKVERLRTYTQDPLTVEYTSPHGLPRKIVVEVQDVEVYRTTGGILIEGGRVNLQVGGSMNSETARRLAEALLKAANQADTLMGVAMSSIK